MSASKRRVALVCLALIVAGAARPALAAGPDRDDDDDDEKAAPTSELVVTARRLDEARAAVAPALGASTYTLSSEAVERRPGGEMASVGQLLLQAPGVAQTGSGRIQIRAQGELQYRINNVILPEGLTDIGESLSTRVVDKVEVITGALPAQYGLHVGGVVNITTKNGVYNQGGQVELYGGSHDQWEPAFEFVGSAGGTNLFASGDYLSSGLGLPSPDGSSTPLHDRTRQLEGLAFLDHVLSPEARVSLVLGGAEEAFQIPHVRGLDAATWPGTPGEPFARPLSVAGVSHYPSERLGGEERDSSVYAMASYQRTTDTATVQASVFARYSSLGITPDPVGDLLYTGIARTTDNTDVTGGVQLEGVYKRGPHRLRGGLVASWTGSTNQETALVLPVDAQGRQTSETPQAVGGRFRERRQEAAVFLQDEWRLGGGLTLNPGLRFDHVQAAGGGDEASPRVNLVWDGPGGVTLHGGYARYFTPAPEQEAPTPPVALAGTTGALPGVASDPLRAESDDYFDVGLERKSGGLTLGLDGYWRTARNLLDEMRIDATSLARPFNYAEGRVRGVELSLTYVEGPVQLWANASAARAEGRTIASQQAMFTAAELAYAQAHFIRTSQDQTWTASAGGTYRFGQLALSAQLAVGSGLPRTPAGQGPNSASLPAHAQLDLSALYHLHGIAGKPVDLRLDLINALDSRYQLRDGTSLGGGAPEWGPRRAVLIGVEHGF